MAGIGTQLLNERKAMGYQFGPVDEQAAAQFVNVPSPSKAMLQSALDRMVSMLRRGEKARGVDLQTMAAVADRLEEMLKEAK